MREELLEDAVLVLQHLFHARRRVENSRNGSRNVSEVKE